MECNLSRFLTRTVLVAAVNLSLAGSAQVGGLEIWDLDFSGSGNPDLVLTESTGINSSTYIFDSRFTAPRGTVPGWLTVSGNPGGLLRKDFTSNTKAGGWTAEWGLKGHPAAVLPSTNVVQFADDTNLINIRYQENQVQLFGAAGRSSAPVNLDVRQNHTYRLVRQPSSSTVELYIDNNTSPAVALTPDLGGNLNRIVAGPSHFESAFDFIRYKSGASLPSPPTPTAAGIYIPTEMQFSNGRSYSVNPAINNIAALSGHPLPELWQAGSTMKIMAARGEYEPATFVLATDTPLADLHVQVGPLTGAAGTLATEALDVRVAQPYYKRITNTAATVPWVLTHDPSLFTIVQQQLPGTSYVYNKKNLLTRASIDTATLQPADVADRQQFWITAHIPDSATPGTYTAPVTVVSSNARDMQLTLEVRVPSLELLEPNFDYSIFYPAFLEGTFTTGQPLAFLTETQYVNEMRNMQEHGLTNPNFYSGVDVNPDGTLDFTLLEHYISLREQAGMNLQGKPLYLPDNPLLIVKRNLTLAEKDQNIAYTTEIVAWANARGYGDVYFFGNDEASAGGLMAQSDSFQSIQDGGGKIFASLTQPSHYDAAGDLLNAPVVQHPGHVLWDQGAVEITGEEFLLNGEEMAAYADPAVLMTPGFQTLIDDVHAHGDRVLAYMDPTGGQTLPEAQRRARGLGLWKVGLDGTMTWAYTHIHGNNVNFAELDPTTDALPDLINSLVLRGEEAPFDTLAFEGFREGVDDARYLATLQAAMSAATAQGQHTSLVNATQQWLDSLNATNADLDAMRLEMARLIEVLAPLVALDPNTTEYRWNNTGFGDWAAGDSNWWPGQFPNSRDHTAIFADTIVSPSTVITDEAVTVNKIVFDHNQSYVIAGFGSVNLQATSLNTLPEISVMQGAHQIQALTTISSDTTVNIAADSTLTFHNALNLNGRSLTKTGAGTVEIRNDLVTAGGTLLVVEGTVLGNGTVGGDLMNTGGTISPGNSSDSLTGPGQVPEPTAWLLAMLGLAGLYARRWDSPR